MIRIAMTREEIDFLANVVPPGIEFDAEMASRPLFSADSQEYSVDWLTLRLKIVAMQRMAVRRPLATHTATYPVDFSPAELWALDGALWRYDYSRMRMSGVDPMGNPVGAYLFTLIAKIWDGLVAYHAEALPGMLQPPRPGAPPESGMRSVPMTQEQRERLTHLDKELDRLVNPDFGDRQA